MLRAFPAFLFAFAVVSAAAQAQVRVPPNVEPAAAGALFSGTAEVSVKGRAGRPVAAFATDSGVYALDPASRSLRVWSYASEKGELSASALTGFAKPVAMARHPSEDVVAVIDGGSGSGGAVSIGLWSFSEESSSGRLSSVAWSSVASFADPRLATGARALAWSADGSTLAVAFTTNVLDTSVSPRRKRYFSYVLPLSFSGSSLSAGEEVRLPLSASDQPDGSVSALAFGPGGEFFVVAAPSGASDAGFVLRFPSFAAAASAPEAKFSNTGVPWSSLESVFSEEKLEELDVPAAEIPARAAAAAPDLHSSISFVGASALALSGPSSAVAMSIPGVAGTVLAVADTGRNRVVFFSDTLFEPIVMWAGSAMSETPWNSFSGPCGVWAVPGSSRLVVADTGNGRVRVIDLDASSLVPVESAAAAFDFVSSLSADAAATNAEIYGVSAVLAEDGFSDGAGAVTGSVRAVSLSFAPSVSNRVFTVSLDPVDPASPDAPAAVLLADDGALSDGAAADASSGAASVSVTIPEGAVSCRVFALPLDGTTTNAVSVFAEGASDSLGEPATFVVTNIPPRIVDASCDTSAADGVADGDSPSGAEVSFSAEFSDVAADTLSYVWTASGDESSVSASPASATGASASFVFTASGGGAAPADASVDLVVSDPDGASASKHYLLKIVDSASSGN